MGMKFWTVQQIAELWVPLMMVIGAALVTSLLILALNWVVWKLVKEIFGWPTIVKALREYHVKYSPPSEG